MKRVLITLAVLSIFLFGCLQGTSNEATNVSQGMPVPSDNPVGETIVGSTMPVPSDNPVDEMIVNEGQ